jgi:broad specificity phosphatase PhoE
MPTKNLILLRHAQALDDVDNNAYTRFLDADMPLTPVGVQQVSDLIPSLETYLGKSVEIFHNGLTRMNQTANCLQNGIPNVQWKITVDSLLNKQDRGSINMENRERIESERYKAGVLRYTFPEGESAESVISRHGQFVSKMLKLGESLDSPETFVIITSGFELRLCMLNLFNWSEEYFESLAYPRNCEFKVVQFHEDRTPVLVHDMRKHKRYNDPDFVRRVT